MPADVPSPAEGVWGSPEGSHQAGSMAAASEAASSQKHGPIQAASRQPDQSVRQTGDWGSPEGMLVYLR
jgi:hypothetical protein